MSTGLECTFIEVKPGRWYYLLEDWDAPKGAFDWREYATAYGPFDTENEAAEHLDDNHANPGGWSRTPYSRGLRAGRGAGPTDRRGGLSAGQPLDGLTSRGSGPRPSRGEIRPRSRASR
ncbi:MAG TPA: hypothetical protein VLW53_04280 [Candidatus Eisenbacteria bacterium]|nr:hypothetical protein [Candidatus Eisenbacteria bacterium]